MNGKGDTPRPVDKALYDANYDMIFRKHVEEDTTAEIDFHNVEATMEAHFELNIPQFCGRN